MRLAEVYKKQIIPQLQKELSLSNILAAPKLQKITVNVGVGRQSKDKEFIDAVVKNLRAITGQQPVLTKAKKSVSAFKVRQGEIVGVTVTLRGRRMYDFMEKLIHITLPRVRDFRGINIKQVDQQGNLSLGFKEQLAFPEVRLEQVDQIHGLEVNIVTTAKNKADGLAFLTLLGLPFSKK